MGLVEKGIVYNLGWQLDSGYKSILYPTEEKTSFWDLLCAKWLMLNSWLISWGILSGKEY